MKKYFLLFLVAFSMIGCANKEKEYAAILKQNNTFLLDQIEAYKVRLDIKKREMPIHYNSAYSKTIYQIVDNTHTLKNYENYKNVCKVIIKLIKDNKLNLKFSPIKSDNVEILKNNLFINVIKIYNIYEFNNTLTRSCGGSVIHFKIRKSITNDSIQLNIEASNPYLVVLDSILDNKKKILDFKSNKEISIWKVKYKSNSKNTKIFGKFYSVEDVYDENPILLQKLN